jgi:hypothetical protein
LIGHGLQSSQYSGFIIIKGDVSRDSCKHSCIAASKSGTTEIQVQGGFLGLLVAVLSGLLPSFGSVHHCNF